MTVKINASGRFGDFEIELIDDYTWHLIQDGEVVQKKKCLKRGEAYNQAVEFAVEEGMSKFYPRFYLNKAARLMIPEEFCSVTVGTAVNGSMYLTFSKT